MDETEKRVGQFLESRGHSIIYEPLGKVAPDFLVDGRIAAEARRLNQNFEKSSGNLEGLENDEQKLRQRVSKLLNSFSEFRRNESWFVSFDFSRPVRHWKKLKPLIRDALLEFGSRHHRASARVRVTPKFTLHFHPSSKASKHFYMYGGSGDDDAGGWLLPEMERNLKFCIERKDRTVDRAKYEEWWLILEDRIWDGLGEDDQRRIQSLKLSKGSWDRVIVISPTRLDSYFEL